MNRNILRASIFMSALFCATGSATQAESIIEKSETKRIELMEYFRLLRPMAYNYPCYPFPECLSGVSMEKPGENVEKYKVAKRFLQEGIMFHYEGNYVNSYNSFLEGQKYLEEILESVSQTMIDRAAEMMQAAIEKKNPADPRDANAIDISIDFGRKSENMRDYKKVRDAAYEDKRYDPRQHHFAMNRYQIEKNIEMGYRHLALAKMARQKGIDVDKYFRPGQQISPDQINKRIEFYVVSIDLARKTKLNAEYIFHLKYPYDNYSLMNPFGKTEKFDKAPKPPETPTIAEVKMNWSENPYLLPKDLKPIFDLTFPEEFRRDAVDARNARYDNEFDINLMLKYIKNKPKQEFLFDPQKGPSGRTEAGSGASP